MPHKFLFFSRMLVSVTLVAALVAAATTEAFTGLVKLKQGAIQGSREEATNGFVYYSFNTIPYARPPVGPFRFKVRCISVTAENCSSTGLVFIWNIYK